MKKAPHPAHRYRHTAEKLRERYGLRLTRAAYQDLCARIRADLAQDRLLTYPAGGTRLFLHVPWRGVTLRLIWCPHTHLIITAHHPHARWERKRARKHARQENRAA